MNLAASGPWIADAGDADTRRNSRSAPWRDSLGGSMQRGRAGWGGVALTVAVTCASPVFGQPTERISLGSAGSQAAGGRYTSRPSVSADGTVVAFESVIASLVPNDTNAGGDIFVVAGGALTRIVGPGAVQGNCAAQRPSVSGDGRYVAFDSCASTYVAGDANGASDVFVLDRTSGVVSRVSVSSAEAEANAPSFSSAIRRTGLSVASLRLATTVRAAPGHSTPPRVYLRDLTTGDTFLVSRVGATGTAVIASDIRPSVADDGSVAFVATSSALVSGDTNASADVFVRRTPTTTGSNVRVSLSAAGGQIGAASTRPSISADGVLVTFETAGAAVAADTNGITDIYVRDTAASTTLLVSRNSGGNGGNGNSFDAALSASGGVVSFTSQAADIDGPFDGRLDVFRATLDRAGALAVTSVVRLSNAAAGTTNDSTASDAADTGRVVFASDEQTLTADDQNGDTDIFSSDGTTIVRLSVTGAGLAETYSGASQRPAPSYDGTIVAFLSSASKLVPGDTNARIDVFVRNRTTGATDRLPVPSGYDTVDADWVSISHDGRFVAYTRSVAFLYDRFTGTTTPVSVAGPSDTPRAAAQARVSPSGRYVAFLTSASLEAADDNAFTEAYLFDRITGTSRLASVGADGSGANSSSTSPGVSGDGRLVVFASAATDLVAGDANGRADIFVRNMATNTTTRLSTNLDALPATLDARDPFISADGNWVSYLLSETATSVDTEQTLESNAYLVRTDGTGVRGPISRVTEGDATSAPGSYDPTVSMFGRYFSFRSYAANLVGGDTNNAADVFARQVLGAAVAAPAVPAADFGPLQRITTTDGGAQATGGTGFDTENPEINGNGTADVYQSGFTNLVAGDTNGIVDAFLRGAIFPGECTFIEATLPGYGAFMGQFGIDPCSNQGSPYADPDGDGFTNDEEKNGAGDGNPLAGAFTRFFAEGATKTAGLNFDTRVALANPSAAEVTGEITYQMPSGQAVPPTQFTLLPFERKTVLLDEQPGIAENGPDQSYEFSTTVKASAPIGVDRTMTWDKGTYAGHAETGVVSAARTWYFAEGATIGGFNLFYLLQNPSSANVTVEGRYLLGTGAVFTKSYTLPPNSRFNVWANVEQFNGVAELASAEFSAVFTVTGGEPIIAERAMYRGASPLFKAGHESAGITEPATEWFLAEGNAGDFFDHFVLIGNTTSTAAFVQADFIVGNTGTIYTRQYQVNANSRFNIWVDEEEVTPGSRPFRTGNTDISVRIRSLNGVPLIVERAMWWPGSSNTWYEAHNSPGASRTASRWVLAEGENGGSIGWLTYILVANTGPTAGTLKIRLLLPGGQTAELTGQPVAAQSRTTYFLADLLQAANLPADTQAGVLIESEGASLPLVVERAMYRNVNGISFQVGTNALGTPLP